MTSDEKKALRKAIIAKRKALNQEWVKANSLMICETIIKLPCYHKANRIALYQAFNGEVDLSHLMEQAYLDNKLVFMPVIRPKTTIMDFKEVDKESSWIKNQYGILEPEGVLEATDINMLDLVLTPLVAFDKKGNRLGMGKGFYDRALSEKKENLKLIGVAYDFQQVDFLSPEPWDIPLDLIITPSQHLLC